MATGSGLPPSPAPAVGAKGVAQVLLAVFWAGLFLGERLSSRQVVGARLILVSALLAATPVVPVFAEDGGRAAAAR